MSAQFKSLFSSNPIDREIFLTRSQNLSIHWADWDIYCEYIRSMRGRESVKSKLSNIKEFKSFVHRQYIWATRNGQTKKIPLSELYTIALIKKDWKVFSDPSNELMVSLSEKHGPFMPVKDLTWFRSDTYKIYLYDKILTGHMIPRRFRLKTCFPIDINIEDNSQLKLKIKQLTHEGFLIEIQNLHKYFELKNATSSKDSLVIKFNYEFFKDLSRHSLKTILARFENLDILSANINARGEYFRIRSSSVNILESDFSRDKYFAFIPYKAFNQVRLSLSVEKTMKGLLEQIEGELEKDLKFIA